MERISLQQFSHWPSWPVPVQVGLTEVTVTSPQACSYLSGRVSVFRAFDAQSIHGEAGLISAGDYQRLMDAGFRRSGTVIYQPMCPACRKCVPLRVPVERFVPTKAQRRAMKRNADLVMRAAAPEPTAEKWDLYERYQREWHDGKQAGDPLGFISFLYRSPVETVEVEYRTLEGRLVGVGICDVGPGGLSSVYFYFDPRERKRSLGTFSAAYEIQWALEMGIPYWYAGYWVEGCATMEYKSRFRPCEMLGTDGVWREWRSRESEE